LHPENNYRLLVVRLGAMGDILHALPAVTALRQAHPNWEIGWVVEPRWRALLTAADVAPVSSQAVRAEPALSEAEGSSPSEDSGTVDRLTLAQPLVNRLHFAATKDWRRRPLSPSTFAAIGALRRELRFCRYNAVLDLQGALRSATIARLSSCARRIGEQSPRERPARLLYFERIVARGAHVIEQDLELASAVAGDALQAAQPSLPVDPAAELWCDALLDDGARPVALISPGGGWGAKRWPAERYRAVAQGLTLRGFRVLVNIGPGELPMAQVICSSGVAQAVSPSVGELIALTRRIALCVAGDTGPLHLACALARPVVGIYGPTDPSRNGPYGTRFRVLRSPASRRDHSRRDETEAGLLTIEPADVLRAAEELLNEVETATLKSREDAT
jgi:heptosyltransferase-1